MVDFYDHFYDRIAALAAPKSEAVTNRNAAVAAVSAPIRRAKTGADPGGISLFPCPNVTPLPHPSDGGRP